MAKTLMLLLGALASKAFGLSLVQPHDFASEGHHSQTSKWMAKHNKQLIIKEQRTTMQDLKKFQDLNHLIPAISNFGHWQVMEVCHTKVTSNLGGMGPDLSAVREIRYHSLANDYLGRELDLVIVNISEYTPYNVVRNQGNPCFAVINVRHGTDVQVIFSLVFAGTNEVTTTTVFRLEDWDLDEGTTGGGGDEEIDVYYHGTGLAGFDLSEHSTVDAEPKHGEIDFIAEEQGGGDDNPKRPDDISDPHQQEEEVDLLSGAPQMMIDLKVNSGHQGRNYLFDMEYATTVTTTCGASCVIWGDPHVVTFDEEVKRHREHPLQEMFFGTRGWKADQVTVSAAGTFWLVKSDRALIQGRYAHNKTHPDVTNLVEIAVGGPFMLGNTLKVGLLGESVMFNGQDILKEMGTSFYKWHACERLVAAKYHPDATMVKNGKKGPGIDIELPEGMRMTINRWHENLAVSISMCPQAGGQDGHCGNYNGDASDDSATMMLKRPENLAEVTSRSSLFRKYDSPKATRRMWRKAATYLLREHDGESSASPSATSI